MRVMSIYTNRGSVIACSRIQQVAKLSSDIMKRRSSKYLRVNNNYRNNAPRKRGGGDFVKLQDGLVNQVELT